MFERELPRSRSFRLGGTERGGSASLTALALLGALALGGCNRAGNDALAPKSPFPTRTELDAIAQSPVRAAPARKVQSITSWTVDPSAEIPAFAAPVLEAKWQERAGDRSLSFAPELRCVARELARFYAEHDAAPDERLDRTIARACGFTSPDIVSSWLAATPAEGTTDQQLIDSMVVPGKISLPLVHRGSQAGLAIARHDKRAVLVAAVGRVTEPVTFSAPDASGRVVVTAKIAGENAGALAYINQGDAGVLPCEAGKSSPEVREWSCRMADGDKTAWVEVLALPRGLVLTRLVAQALVRRDAKGPLEYRSTAAAPRPVTTTESFVSALFEGINQRRTAAKLAPLALAELQTKGDSARLAPHFFHAELVSDAGRANQIALGLIAGWEVPGTIRTGGFSGALLSGTTDASLWLESVLEMPSSRISLFDKDARWVAIGASPAQTLGGLGAVVTTYSLFDKPDHAGDAERLFARVVRERAARGLAKPERVPTTPALAAAAAEILRNEKTPVDAMDGAMSLESERTGRAVSGRVITASNLESGELDPGFLASGPLSIMLEVTHYKPAGAAWGSYVVIALRTPAAK